MSIDLGRYLRTQYNVQLQADIPTKGDPVRVTIAATNYPDVNDMESLNDIKFRIVVNGLDTYLYIGSESVNVQSLAEEYTSYTNGRPDEGSLRPRYYYPASLEELSEYKSLIRSLGQEGVTFEGSAKPVIKYSSVS